MASSGKIDSFRRYKFVELDGCIFHMQEYRFSLWTLEEADFPIHAGVKNEAAPEIQNRIEQ
jgi:hypothetical protein